MLVADEIKKALTVCWTLSRDANDDGAQIILFSLLNEATQNWNSLAEGKNVMILTKEGRKNNVGNCIRNILMVK